MHRSGRRAEAERLYRRVLKADEKNAGAWHGLGTLAMQSGRVAAALDMLERAVQLAPRAAPFHANLSQLYLRIGRQVKARCVMQRALELRPDGLDMWIALGGMCVATGRFDQAEDAYKRALQLEGDHPAAVAGLATVHERRGDAEAAYKILAPLLGKPHVDDRVLTVFATLCLKLNMHERGIDLLSKAAADESLAAPRKEVVCFRLADLYAQAGRYGAAFETYSKAHLARQIRWDPAKWTQLVTQITETYTHRNLAAFARSTCDDQAPVFIIGMPRSGTSLIEQTITTHPQAFGAGELSDIGDMILEMHDELDRKRFFPMFAPDLTRAQLDRHAAAQVRRLRDLSPDADRVIDKLPSNFINLGLIAQLLPHARVIHAVRNSLDTCVSIFTTRFNFGHQWSADLAHLGRYYADYKRLMDHWRNALELPVLEVRYEDMVADHEASTRRILKFLGLAWDPACLRFYETDRDVLTASYDQVRKPIYHHSVGRWKHYAKHLEPLTQAMRAYGTVQ